MNHMARPWDPKLSTYQLHIPDIIEVHKLNTKK